MTVNFSDELNQWAAKRNVSIEIAFGIFQITGEEPPEYGVVSEGPGAEQANEIWLDPTDEQQKRVTQLAWEIADEDEDWLYWGERITRNQD